MNQILIILLLPLFLQAKPTLNGKAIVFSFGFSLKTIVVTLYTLSLSYESY